MWGNFSGISYKPLIINIYSCTLYIVYTDIKCKTQGHLFKNVELFFNGISHAEYFCMLHISPAHDTFEHCSPLLFQ